MYIRKEISTPFGVDAYCHRLHGVHAYFNDKLIHIHVQVFLTDIATQAIGDIKQFEFSEERGNWIEDPDLSISQLEAYEMLLTLPYFEGAEIVDE